MFDAVKAAPDPSPAQEKPLASHTGGARFAYNAMLARAKTAFDAGENIEQSFYAPHKQWNINKDTLAVGDDGEPRWAENPKGSPQSRAGIFGEGGGSPNWPKNRKRERGRPERGRRAGHPKSKPKSKTTPRSAYTTGAFGLINGDPKTIRPPKTRRVHRIENAAERVGDAKALRMTITQRAGR